MTSQAFFQHCLVTYNKVLGFCENIDDNSDVTRVSKYILKTRRFTPSD